MTDEFTSYKELIYKEYVHRFIEHRKEQYASGNVHVNGMSRKLSGWNWTKELMFKFHGVFKRNLFYYLKEMEWKFNHRHLNPKEKTIVIAKLLNKKNNRKRFGCYKKLYIYHVFPAWVRLPHT